MKIFCVLGRIVRDTSPRALRLSREFLHRRIFIVRAAGAPLSSPAKFPFAGAELLLPARSGTSCFQTCVLSSCVILYATASSFSRHFPPPAPAGSVFFCDLICRQFAASRSSIWAQIARWLDRRFSACLLHLDLACSVSAFLLVQVFSLHRSGGSGTCWLV